MSSPEGLAAGTNPSWAQNFRNRFHRYRVLFGKYWWVVALTTSIAIFLGAWYVVASPQYYISDASLAVTAENQAAAMVGQNSNGGQQLSEELDKRKAEIDTVPVRQLALQQLQAAYPDMTPVRVDLDIKERTSLLDLQAKGRDPLYTQRYLQALIDAYLQKRRESRAENNGETLDKVREEIKAAEEALKIDGDEMNDYQKKVGIVFEKDTSPEQSALATLTQQLSTLRDEVKKLSVMSPTDYITNNAPGQQSEYSANRQQMASLKAEYDALSVDLRPKHPKLQRLKTQIDNQQKVIDDLLKANAKSIADQRALDEQLIKTTEAQIEDAKQQALKTDLLRVGFNKLAEKKARDEKNLGDLQGLLNSGKLMAKVNPETVSVWQKASGAAPAPSMWPKIMALAVLAGLVSGVGILLFIDRIDDRMGSISDFQLHFSEHVLGQIPRDSSAEAAELLRPDDERHQLVESFRNLRSTLLYMPLEGARPKTILITSAVPNEGKSTVSSNLALVLAFAGMKTLLIDCDLRRGAIHKAFDLPRSPGLTDVLGHNGVNWKLAIRESGVENLHILPRGRNVPQPSEYLLNRNTDALLKELYPLYDYIIIDSSPILAADDTASLAPKIDSVLFVCRLSFTSAKMTRKSLEILYKRQANIPGLILNQVDTSSPEFVYYQYSEYYHAMGPEEEEEQPVKVRKRRKVAADSPAEQESSAKVG